MKRILVVDDERPVVDAIGLMIRRDLPEEFAVVGEASSGRDAIEKAAALAPDIVLMDILMPGISGLEAVREIRSRGLPCVFILITAYERFDIAREAMELGVLDYLLKPVARDKLAAALRTAASFSDRRFEIERLETRHREREMRLRSFVEEAFFRAMAMETGPGFAADGYGEILGLGGSALVAAASFLPPGGTPDPAAEAMRLYAAFKSTVRYKTRAMVGPFMSGFAAVLLPLASPESEADEAEAFSSALGQAHADELADGSISVGYARAATLGEANRAWSMAFRNALVARESLPGAGMALSAGAWEETRAFVGLLAGGDSGGARITLEKALEPLIGSREVSVSDRYRVIALFAEACREFERKGFLDTKAAGDFMDMDDLRAASSALALTLAARSRFSILAEAAMKAPRWSVPLARAMSFVKSNLGRQISLESVAAEIPLSPNHLSRLFVDETGRGFSDYLIELRIARAKELLGRPGASIKRVSAECGYPDPNYFSRLFKKATGFTPSAFSAEPREGSYADS